MGIEEKIANAKTTNWLTRDFSKKEIEHIKKSAKKKVTKIMDDYTIEFKINDVVIITVDNPDGCEGNVLGSIGIIFDKDGSDYEVWAKCDDRYMPMWFGAEQMRHASPEEINSEFRNLITMYRLEKMHEHTEEEKRLGYAIRW